MTQQIALSGKEPWEMTAHEYLSHIGVHAGASAITEAVNEHSRIVYRAIQEGHTPPMEVLIEYPTAAISQPHTLKLIREQADSRWKERT